MIYLCLCGNTEFVPEKTEAQPVQVVDHVSPALGAASICSNGNCARPLNQASILRLSCPGCQYDHFIRDLVINDVQTLICAHCGERWELDHLKMQALIQVYEARQVSVQAVSLDGGN